MHIRSIFQQMKTKILKSKHYCLLLYQSVKHFSLHSDCKYYYFFPSAVGPLFSLEIKQSLKNIKYRVFFAFLPFQNIPSIMYLHNNTVYTSKTESV